MSNPFARLLAQAEVNVADVARRSMESVTLPIKLKSQEMIAEIVESASTAARTIAIKAGLGLFAGIMLVVALVYALAALHADLAVRLGPIKALLIMSGIFLALAIVAVVAIVAWPKPAAKVKVKAKIIENRAVEDATQVAAAAKREVRVAAKAGPHTAEPETDLKSGFDAVVSALGEAGFKREQAGLRAGIAIANQLRPMQVVSLALLGGFIAGVRMTGRRSR